MLDLVGLKPAFWTRYLRYFRSEKPKYLCEVCGYKGAFRDKTKARKKFGNRISAKCPVCDSMERQRFQHHLLNRVLAERDRQSLSMLHFSPEPSLGPMYRKQFGEYCSTDLLRTDVDMQFDVQEIPFTDNRFDVILIAHVLQYVSNYCMALSELARVLKPGGIMLAPVPLVHFKTLAKEVPDPDLKMVCEPGLDYFDRYHPHFSLVILHHSSDYPDQFHFFREFPEELDFPLAMGEGRYGDIIPVCYK